MNSSQSSTTAAHVGSPENNTHFIEVAVITTSGSWPTVGHESVPQNQPIHVQLDQAARKLKIKDTTNWVARADGRELDPKKSYLDEGLKGKVDIDYGPREGGGGNA